MASKLKSEWKMVTSKAIISRDLSHTSIQQTPFCQISRAKTIKKILSLDFSISMANFLQPSVET